MSLVGGVAFSALGRSCECLNADGQLAACRLYEAQERRPLKPSLKPSSLFFEIDGQQIATIKLCYVKI